MTQFFNAKKEYWLRHYANPQPDEPLPRLPAGYVEGVAVWTTSTNKGRVTDYVISSDDEWIVTCARNTGDSAGNLAVVGTGLSKTDSNMALWLNPTTNLVEFTFGDGGNSSYKVTTNAYDVTKMHTYRMKLSTGEAWIDDNYIGKSQSLSSVPHPKPLAIFGSYRGTTINSSFLGTVAEIIVKRSDVEVAHWVPCLYMNDISYAGNWAHGFYEIVGNTFTQIYQSELLTSYDVTWSIEVAANETYGVRFFSKHLLDTNCATLDFGDGTVNTYTADVATSPYPQHTYTTAGTYTLSLHIPYGSTLNLNPIGQDNNSGTTTIKSCTSFTSTRVPANIFWGCNALESATLHGPIASVETRAFYFCRELQMTRLPDGISHVNSEAFKTAQQMALEKFPRALTTITGSGFMHCNAICISEVPEGCTYIGTAGVREALGITALTLPSTLDTLYTDAFKDCSNMTIVTFKSTPTTMTDDVFEGCNKLTTIRVPWSEGTVVGAPWGATNATVIYDYTA